MKQDVEVKYTASATSQGGRHGHVKSADGMIDVDTTEPKELGGSGEMGKTNPEQLFAAGYAACFSSAAKLAAETMNLSIDSESLVVKCDVSLGKDKADEGFGLKVKMEMKVDGIGDEQKQQLIQRANEICPYSKATKGNIDIELVTR